MEVVFANTTCSTGTPGGGVADLVKGEPWPADDPLVLAKPEFFSESPLRIKTSRGYLDVEQATAAPGETRKRR